MKARLSRKIFDRLPQYVSLDTNYFPYSMGQVEKAIRRQRKLPPCIREEWVYLLQQCKEYEKWED